MARRSGSVLSGDRRFAAGVSPAADGDWTVRLSQVPGLDNHVCPPLIKNRLRQAQTWWKRPRKARTPSRTGCTPCRPAAARTRAGRRQRQRPGAHRRPCVPEKVNLAYQWNASNQSATGRNYKKSASHGARGIVNGEEIRGKIVIMVPKWSKMMSKLPDSAMSPDVGGLLREPGLSWREHPPLLGASERKVDRVAVPEDVTVQAATNQHVRCAWSLTEAHRTVRGACGVAQHR